MEWLHGKDSIEQSQLCMKLKCFACIPSLELQDKSCMKDLDKSQSVYVFVHVFFVMFWYVDVGCQRKAQRTVLDFSCKRKTACVLKFVIVLLFLNVGFVCSTKNMNSKNFQKLLRDSPLVATSIYFFIIGVSWCRKTAWRISDFLLGLDVLVQNYLVGVLVLLPSKSRGYSKSWKS